MGAKICGGFETWVKDLRVESLIIGALTCMWIAGMGFLRRPLALVAAVMAALSIAFLNDRYDFC